MAELGYKVVERQQMYELNPGDVDGLSPAEIQERFPAEFDNSQKHPYSHRYPRAESYHDLSVRLEPVILELEREPADVLFIGHGSVIRCLMAYLQGLTPQEIPNVELRRGDVVQVTPSACKRSQEGGQDGRESGTDSGCVCWRCADGVNFQTHFFWQ